MSRSATFLPTRLVAILCIALALVFAGTVASGVVNQVQHAGGPAQVHHHTALAQAAAIDDHHADHRDDGGHDDSRDGLGGDAPGHHHHADAGQGIAVLAAATAERLMAVASKQPLATDRSPARAASYGPERPPRTIGIDV